MKPNRSLFIPSILISFLASTGGLNAEQISIENFQSFPLGEVSPENWPYALAPASDAPRIMIHQDPQDASNKALFIDSSEVDLVWGDSFVSIPFPENEQIALGESGTLSFRAYLTGYSNSWYFMTSDLETVDAWAGGCSIIEVHENLPGVIKARNGNAFSPSDPNAVMNLNTWYEFEVAIDNQSKTYQVFLKGPEDTEKRRLTFGSTTSPAFRRNSQGAIQTITIATYNGAPGSENDGDLWLIDDISLVVQNPKICDYEIIDGDHIDTGNWLGWLYVASYPWTYCWNLSSWLYFSSCPGTSTSGAWIYFSR